MSSIRRVCLLSAALLALLPTSVAADWTMYHFDPSHSGNDTTEPAASGVANVWNTSLSGQVYAEPLVAGSTVLVATEQNNVYALDAATGGVRWSTALGTPVSQSSLPCGNINPVGITGTPVVDTSSGLMYVVASLTGPLHYELYAINISNGTIAWHETIAPANFNFIYQGQRGALALANGRVYIPFGGRSGDCGTYSGWVVSALASGPGSILSFSLPNGPHMGGIWAAGGLAVDASGNIYAATGNTSCGSNCVPFDYGESVIKLSPNLGTLNYWAATNYASLNQSDTDVGSVGPMLLPGSIFLFQVGKAGDGYLINTTNMGGISNAPFSAHVCPGLTVDAAFGGSAYAAPYIYAPCNNGLVALNANLSTPSFSFAWQGPSVSNAGPPIVAGGLVWTIDPGGHLYGLDPATGAQRYNFNITSANHFATPAAGTGRLFVPAGQVIRAYSLAPMPAVTLNPTGLVFSNRAQGTTSPAQTATITNSGTAPLTINAIAASGDFAQTNNCGALPASLAVGASCTLSVTFTPTGSGTRWGAVSITDNATGSRQQLGLTGYSFAFVGAYTLDGFGGLHADGGSAAMNDSAYWPGWKIARSGALLPGGAGGFVLDGYGGVHTFGNIAPVPTAYFGWDIARDIVFLPSATPANPQGYTLDGYGGIHPFGGAPAISGGAYWRGWDIAKRFALLSDGSGGYILDGYGGLHPFAVGNIAMPPSLPSAYWNGWNIARDIALAPGSTATNVAGVTLDGFGGVHPFGAAGAIQGPSAYWPNWDIARAVRYAQDSTAGTPKGWVMDGYGGLHPFGGAPAIPMGGYWPNWDIATQLILG